MIKHIWTILCRRSVIDNETNNISLYDSIEEFTVGLKANITNTPGKLPEAITIQIEYEIVSMWFTENRGQTIKADTEIEIIQPNGKSAKTFSQPIEIPNNKQRLRTRMRISGFVVTMPGVYWFKVKIKEDDSEKFRTVAEIPLEVKLHREVEVRQ